MVGKWSFAAAPDIMASAMDPGNAASKLATAIPVSTSAGNLGKVRG